MIQGKSMSLKPNTVVSPSKQLLSVYPSVYDISFKFDIAPFKF